MLISPPPQGGIFDSAYWRTWIHNLWKGTVHNDRTSNVTVGYTTDIEAVGSVVAASTLTPDLTTEHLKTATIEGSFTLAEPTTTGHCEFYLTVTGVGSWVITPGTGVKYVGTLDTLMTGTNYILNVRRYGASQTVIQVVELM